MKKPILYTASQIAAITGFALTTIYEKIKVLKISPEITRLRLNYYNDVDFTLICVALSTAQKEKQITMYYPMKTTETFHIYQSKLNSL
jgi:hypothetical protein